MRTTAFGGYALCASVAAALLSGCSAGAGSAVLLPHASSNAFSNHETFHYAGKRQSFKVPLGVEWIDVVARGGAGGGEPSYSGKSGAGLGGRVHALLPVVQGETLYVVVGGASEGFNGGYNGGGVAGSEYGRAGFGGGGASDIRENGYGLRNRVLVVGGGGGQGELNHGGVGGAGGGKIGGTGGGYSSGSCGYYGGGGGGGTQVGGGAGGCGAGAGSSQSGADGEPGSPGTLGGGGSGGAGGDNTEFGSGSAGGGGGGGGGYYGGGGGGGGAAPYFSTGPGGGGGGGSSYVRRGTKDARFWQGWKNATGDGLVVLSW